MDLFFRKKTPQEVVRENQRLLNRSIREIDRERGVLENQEKRLVAEIKRNARLDQHASVKVLAKDLVTTRRYIEKFFVMRAQLQGASMRLQTIKSNNAIAEAMVGVSRAMKTINSRLNLGSIQKIMQDFEKQTMTMELREEMISDVVDDTLHEDMGEDTDEIVSKVLGEIGISLTESASTTPSDQPEKDPDADLEARVMNLRKN